MTRKDYELIAEAIKDVGLFYHVGQPQLSGPVMRPGDVLFSVASELARELAAENPRFDRQRFWAACGLDKGGRFQP